MPKQVYVKLSTAGLDAGPFNITNDAGQTIATGVTKIALSNGIYYTMSDNASLVTITSTGSCTNSIVVPIAYIQPVPTPTPSSSITPTPTATATPTPSGSLTPAPITLTLSWIKQAKMFSASLSQSIGVDLSNMSIFVDGYANSGCSTAIASASDVRNFVILPAGNIGYSWSPQVICGSNTSSSCWNTATNYTIYNVNINGNVVSNGQTITVGGVPIIVNFPPCRSI